MFANLKNKIREETGSDLSQLAPKLASGVQQRVAAGFREIRNRGSTSSLSALEEENAGSPEDGSDGMKLAAASLKSRGRDVDWKQHAETLSCEKAVLEDEKAQLVRRNLELTEALAEAENYKKKAVQYQEDLDQLEGFQTQEMAKIKHLLLEREQQLTENSATISKLQADIARLRSCQEELSNVQDELDALRHSSELQRQKLTAKLEEAESDRRLLGEKLERTSSLLAAASSDEGIQGALAEARDVTERRLEETRLELADVKSKWCSQVMTLETQLGRLSLQAGEEGAERRRAEKALKDLEQRLTTVIAERDETMTQLQKMETTHEESSAAKQEWVETEQKLQSRLQVLESENNTLNKKCTHVESLESEHRALLEKCKKLEANQRNVQEETRLKENVVTLQAKLLVLEEKISNLQSIKEEKEKEVQRHKEQTDTLNAERDSLLLRNASLSQQGELACRELQEEIVELKQALDLQKQESTQQLSELRSQLEKTKQADLSSVVANLEEQLIDKNKNIKVLQQRLADMKKTLQRELKCPSQNVDGSSTSSANSGSSSSNIQPDFFNAFDGSAGLPSSKPIDDVNHTYLKHVLIKFLTSREYEAKHLTRAVATLLHFTAEEERLLRETLEWKMSWFGTKPNLGNGQTAKTIPPS